MAYNLQPTYPSIESLESRDKALSVMYGRTIGGPLVPIKVDTDGRIVLGSSISVEADLGEITIKGTSNVAQTAEERLGLSVVSGIPSAGLVGQFALLTEDPRQNFTNGGLNVNGSDQLYVTEAFATADAIANARPSDGNLDTRHYKSKTVAITNTGANDARITIMGSVDGGSNFDITILSDGLLTAGNTVIADEARAMTDISIEARSDMAGMSTTVNSRAYAQGT